MIHFEQNKSIFILIVNPITSCLTYANDIGNGYRIKLNCQLYPSSANENAHAWPIYKFNLHSLNLNPCLSQKSTIKDTITQKILLQKIKSSRKQFFFNSKTQSHVTQTWYWRPLWYHCWNNLVFVSHTKTHAAEATTKTDLLQSWTINM